MPRRIARTTVLLLALGAGRPPLIGGHLQGSERGDACSAYHRAMAIEETIRTLGSAGTVIAVSRAALQLSLNRRQTRANFEDDLSREYRAISATLPADAFFRDADRSAALTAEQSNAMFRYFDLSNEQLRFCQQGRVSRQTERAWKQ